MLLVGLIALSSCPAGPWSERVSLALSFDTEIDIPPAAQLLPAGLDPIIVPSTLKAWTNATIASVYAFHYESSPVGPYYELVVALAVRHAPSNHTGRYIIALYSDSEPAVACGVAQWGVSGGEVAHFSLSRSTMPYVHDELAVKSSSSVFAKTIATFAAYYSPKIIPAPGPVANATMCASVFAAANCTKSAWFLSVVNASLLAWEFALTGDVMPALSTFSLVSGCASDLGLNTKTGIIPTRKVIRQVNSSGSRRAPSVVCTACMPYTWDSA